MVYEKKLLGGKLEITPSECPHGAGIRFGVVKRFLAEKAMLEENYLDKHGGTLFDGSPQLFVSTNKGQRFVEKIDSSTKTMRECIKRIKKNRLQKEIELVLSFGHKKLNSDAPDFVYKSDYSKRIRLSDLFERPPKKFDDRTPATKRREGKIASNLQEIVAEKFTKSLHENIYSPVYQGFTFEHSVAFRKAFSVLKVDGKYLWEAYLCEDKRPDMWPSLKFLTIDLFHNLPLTHSDKVLKKMGSCKEMEPGLTNR